MVFICGCRPDQAVAPEQPKPPSIPVSRDGDGIVLGPFSGWVRGVDWFWMPDGQMLILTAEKHSQIADEPVMQLWVVDASSGDSRLLREAQNTQAIFPIAFLDDSVLCIEIAHGSEHKNLITAVSTGERDTTVLVEFEGFFKRHAVTPDAQYVSVYYTGREGGRIIRVNTADGVTTELVSALPLSDGLFPVWFSPDGRTAVMPETEYATRPFFVTLLNLITGEKRSLELGKEPVEWINWSPSGDKFAYKVTDGRHKRVDLGESTIVLSPQVRVLDNTGSPLALIEMVSGRLAGAIGWYDEHTLVIGEGESVTETFPVWTATLDGEMRRATASEAEVLQHSAVPFPMERGESAEFSVQHESWHEQGSPPQHEIHIRALR